MGILVSPRKVQQVPSSPPLSLLTSWSTLGKKVSIRMWAWEGRCCKVHLGSTGEGRKNEMCVPHSLLVVS